MPEEQEGQGEMPEETAQGETPQGDGNATITADELAELKAALKRANAEAAERRIKLQEYEEAEQARKEAEMSELEKLQAQLEREREARAAAEREATQRTIRHAVELQATAMGFHNPPDAMAFVDADALTINDEGAVEGVETSLKALLKDRPYLAKGEAKPPRDVDGTQRGNAPKQSTDEQLEQVKRRFGIS